jgi:hypothetical protein
MTHLLKIMHRSAQALFCNAAVGESFVMLQHLFCIVFLTHWFPCLFVCLPLTCTEIGTEINFLPAVRSCRGWDRAVWWCGQFYTFPFYSTRPFSKPLHTQLHCKKRLTIFPSPGRVSLTKLSLAGNNKIFPARESLVSDIPAGDWKIYNIFLQCMAGKDLSRAQLAIVRLFDNAFFSRFCR